MYDSENKENTWGHKISAFCFLLIYYTTNKACVFKLLQQQKVYVVIHFTVWTRKIFLSQYFKVIEKKKLV